MLVFFTAEIDGEPGITSTYMTHLSVLPSIGHRVNVLVHPVDDSRIKRNLIGVVKDILWEVPVEENNGWKGGKLSPAVKILVYLEDNVV